MAGTSRRRLAVLALLAALAGAVFAVRAAARPPGHRHRDPAGHLRGAAHRRARRRAAAGRADRGRRPARRSATCGPWSARPAWRSLPAGESSPSTGDGAHHRDQFAAAAGRPSRPAARRVLGERRPALRPGRLPGPRARSSRRSGRTAGGRRAGRARRRPAGARAGPGHAGDRALGRHPARPGRAGLVPGTLARAEVRALRAQISPHFIYNALTAIASLRPDRPGAGPGADPRVRRVHPVLVPGARRVHHARRGAALDRPVPDHRAGPVRRPAAGTAADRARGAAGHPAVPVPPAAGGERGPARVVPQARSGHGQHRGPGRRRRVPHHRRGRRGGHGSGRPRAKAEAALDTGRRPASTSACPTSTSGCGRSSATSSAWWWRPARGRDEGQHAGAEVPPRGPGQRERDRPPSPGFLRVLAVDDEPPALDELAYLLRADPRVARLHTAGDATEALRVLRDMRRGRGVPGHPDARPGRDGAGPGAAAGSPGRRRSSS